MEHAIDVDVDTFVSELPDARREGSVYLAKSYGDRLDTVDLEALGALIAEAFATLT